MLIRETKRLKEFLFLLKNVKENHSFTVLCVEYLVRRDAVLTRQFWSLSKYLASTEPSPSSFAVNRCRELGKDVRSRS